MSTKSSAKNSNSKVSGKGRPPPKGTKPAAAAPARPAASAKNSVKGSQRPAGGQKKSTDKAAPSAKTLPPKKAASGKASGKGSAAEKRSRERPPSARGKVSSVSLKQPSTASSLSGRDQKNKASAKPIPKAPDDPANANARRLAGQPSKESSRKDGSNAQKTPQSSARDKGPAKPPAVGQAPTRPPQEPKQAQADGPKADSLPTPASKQPPSEKSGDVETPLDRDNPPKVVAECEMNSIEAKMILHPSSNLRDVTLKMGPISWLGHGVFGNVYKATVFEPPPETDVAVKKIWPQDDDDRERQLYVYRQLNHENLCRLLFFYTSNVPQQKKSKKSHRENARQSSKEGAERPCWCLVTEFVETSCKSYHEKLRKSDQFLDQRTVQIWTYQLWCALEFMHAKCIVHRDLKPDNMLLDSRTQIIKIADFGSAKMVTNEHVKSEAYMITRYYRPPEMILGSQYYNTKVDIWSAACVLAEFQLGEILWEGDDRDDQFERIQLGLGSPTTDEIERMNPHFKMDKDWIWKRDVQPKEGLMDHVFSKDTDARLLDFLVNKLFKYDPKERYTAEEAKRHPYYDDLYEKRDELAFKLLPDKPKRDAN